jgi:hypothetical protein
VLAATAGPYSANLKIDKTSMTHEGHQCRSKGKRPTCGRGANGSVREHSLPLEQGINTVDYWLSAAMAQVQSAGNDTSTTVSSVDHWPRCHGT